MFTAFKESTKINVFRILRIAEFPKYSALLGSFKDDIDKALRSNRKQNALMFFENFRPRGYELNYNSLIW